MITKILIPIDYSEASFNALETAICIAKRNNASIQLLHVNDTALVPEESYALKNTNQISYAIADNIFLPRWMWPTNNFSLAPFHNGSSTMPGCRS